MAQESNLFLDSLSPESRASLVKASCFVSLALQTPLLEPGITAPYAYFLTAGIASTVTMFVDGGAAEVGVLGREGIVGGLQLLGPAAPSTHSMMQVGGEGFRLPMSSLQRAFDTSAEIHARILEVIQVNAFITTQLAGCHALHQMEARLSRWLLMVADRTGLQVLQFTQKFLAQMLGARRTTVTNVAGAMQESGVIRYSRGRVKILDRKALEDTACPCYRIVKTFADGLYAEPVKRSSAE